MTPLPLPLPQALASVELDADMAAALKAALAEAPRAFADPAVHAAIEDVRADVARIANYKDDPAVMGAFEKLLEVWAGAGRQAAGGAGAPRGAKLVPAHSQCCAAPTRTYGVTPLQIEGILEKAAGPAAGERRG